MDLSTILSISGKAGLFKLISKGNNNFIVESLLDKKRMPAFSHDGVSSLDNIAIFTEKEDLPIGKVFETIYKKENAQQISVPLEDNVAIKRYFEEIVPNYDRERVYVSNMKKVYNWYNILIENQLLEFGD